jgi:hypothetical protein
LRRVIRTIRRLNLDRYPQSARRLLLTGKYTQIADSMEVAVPLIWRLPKMGSLPLNLFGLISAG